MSSSKCKKTGRHEVGINIDRTSPKLTVSRSLPECNVTKHRGWEKIVSDFTWPTDPTRSAVLDSLKDEEQRMPKHAATSRRTSEISPAEVINEGILLEVLQSVPQSCLLG